MVDKVIIRGWKLKGMDHFFAIKKKSKASEAYLYGDSEEEIKRGKFLIAHIVPPGMSIGKVGLREEDMYFAEEEMDLSLALLHPQPYVREQAREQTNGK